MVFNWFRRQFSHEQAAPSTEEQATTTPPEAEESTEAEIQSDASAEISADYLSFAKAAYKNIQQRQAQSESVAEPAPIESTTDEVISSESSEPEATSTEAIVSETPTDEIEPVVVADEPEPSLKLDSQVENVSEPPVTETESIVTEDEPTASQIEAEVVTEDEPTANETETSLETPAESLPFWARAEAERQARLERLKATAIEEPEPVLATTAETPQIADEASDFNLVFDEGFLWSAEILAAQGRKPEDVSIEEITWLKKLRQGLDKTRRNLVNQIKAIVGQGPLNQAAVLEIEALLLQADVGVEATDYIINALQERIKQEALPPEVAIAYLKEILRGMLERPLTSHNATFAPEKDTLNIWLMTGVNGAGKTTTIGKIAHIAQKSGYNCLIAAADTFRAAAVEQVKIWGSRSGVEVIANPGQNTDPAAVVFDAITAAQSRNIELLLIDTAGRLQNKKNLMDELSKIRRIVDKKAPYAKIESLLVLDATLGQNGLRQAEVFAQAAQLSGVVLTKLDGTAKGGVALAVVQQLNLPIRFIGAGEGVEDLRPFSSYEFVEALLSS
ncbi:signal recognition particle-docking protein FtsY [Gloeocapsopsis dulcis]|uniref:Signal recognition particle receptor FtsY n=1 Tax=Gloeocapsopsis dulcis AAB1 = 1H9 TaxID=1433147 RepID=A0A6N8FVV9_9CHRO|nr:signal recognition particle-docking protein FtsY [Gloeocapsopsis dulcis]MUL36999.1 signal recognition particle-docking protein FtsY [Gloeocapsopsis dulcis AAB1 = 1H9]WNN87854.1 signal recognition particle-docking protein FtsY [Gloeocapsopsis dulcis]